MTDEQIDALTAGPEIDELVARRVMKFTEQQINAHRFRPSTDIADTQRVWEELIGREWWPKHECVEGQWHVHLWHRDYGDVVAYGPALELAMTKAALKAVGTNP